MLKYLDKNKQKIMQFKVPQDVQREDTIIGPLTLKQLGIIGLGGGLAYAVYISLAKTYFMEIWLPPVAIISGLTLAIAFLKIHDLSFGYYIMYLVEFNLLPKKRRWTQGTGTPIISPFELVKQKKAAPKTEDPNAPKKKSLNELATIVDSYGENAKREIAEKEIAEKTKNMPQNNITNSQTK